MLEYIKIVVNDEPLEVLIYIALPDEDHILLTRNTIFAIRKIFDKHLQKNNMKVSIYKF
ncbi:hypothetical protein MA16_Dca014764 [Dendrobium catenatum]|uniref:Uncharacterized protein n=1 Tax=Dendrobium catenatum TaxID=906689 RepID=A0A2I0VIQ6_9ASPA|nr:hypothetical protein MA16_Dca014764 [Dendrobium catenatum]